jgi:hypothetical protein
VSGVDGVLRVVLLSLLGIVVLVAVVRDGVVQAWVCGARRDRAVARAEAGPGGLVAYERRATWSDGTVTWEPVTAYAQDGYELGIEVAAARGPAVRNVVVVRDPSSTVGRRGTR